jgi:nucleoside-diphosphate-sugar epimerase
MRILVIGGTGFIGRPLVRELGRLGHDVAVLTRSGAHSELPAETIVGERRDLSALRPPADVVIDLILSSGAQARQLMDTFRGVAKRVVAASSMDVYRACGILHGSESGPLEPVPLTEDSALRTKLQTYPPESIKRCARSSTGWTTSTTRSPWSAPSWAIPICPERCSACR